MTAGNSTETTNLTELVGEIEIACERPAHGHNTRLHDDGPATHYVQTVHPCPGREGVIEAICTRNAIDTASYPDGMGHCVHCQYAARSGDLFRVLGPIKGY